MRIGLYSLFLFFTYNLDSTVSECLFCWPRTQLSAVVLGNRAKAIWTLTGTSAKVLNLSIASSKFCLEAKPAKQRAVVLQYMRYFRVVA